MATTAFIISASDSEWNLTPSHDRPRKNTFPYVMQEDKPSAIPKPTSSFPGSIIGPVYSLASEPMEGEVYNVAYPVLTPKAESNVVVDGYECLAT